MNFGFLSVALLAALLACSGCAKPSYPKERLYESVQKMFQEELGVNVRTKLAGKTLYVSFPIQGLVSENFELSKDVTSQLENAMISISRIALNTDAEVDFTVLEAVDSTWGIHAILIRKLQDLKDSMYWKISKSDFDERIVLEIRKDHESDGAFGSTASVSAVADEESWEDIQLPEYMGRWVASRINLGTQANPFLGVLLGVEKLTSKLDMKSERLVLEVDHFETLSSSGVSTISSNLLRNTVCEQMSSIEKKYSPKNWVREVVLQDRKGTPFMAIAREEWQNFDRKRKANLTKDPVQTGGAESK